MTRWASTILQITAPKINKHQHTACLRGLVHHLKAKEISGWNEFLILACFHGLFSTMHLFIYWCSERARGYLWEKAQNKYVSSDMFILSMFSYFSCGALCLLSNQLACFCCCWVFLCVPTLLILHTLWQRTPEQEYKTKAVKCKSHRWHTCASVHFHTSSFIWLIWL